MINKQKGQMYGWVNATWNPIRGDCKIHDCTYCYMKRFPQKTVHLDEKCLKNDLGSGNTIFVGSSTDMFAENIPYEWIKKVLDHCKEFDNTYLFQSKNPVRFLEFVFPPKVILGTTMETNDVNNYAKYSKAPLPSWRASAMDKLPKEIDRMVSIEPIMKFGHLFSSWIKDINPKFVSIGADSKGNNLPEPSKEELLKLISELEKFTEVRLKPNLKRLMK